jgi:hypothetical protein
MRAALVLGVGLLLSGCADFAGAYVSPPDVGPEERAQAFADCSIAAKQAPILSADYDNMAIFSRARENLLVSCMEAHGYSLFPNFVPML